MHSDAFVESLARHADESGADTGFRVFVAAFWGAFLSSWCGGKACVLASRLHTWLLPRGGGPFTKKNNMATNLTTYIHHVRYAFIYRGSKLLSGFKTPFLKQKLKKQN